MSRTSLVQKEIDRVVKYAQGLGIKVTLRNITARSGNQGGWSIDPPCIFIYTKGITKQDVLLSLLHELGHHHDWIETGRPDFQAVFEEECNRKEDDPPLVQSKRGIIYRDEAQGISYMLGIADVLDLRTPPRWRIIAEMFYDRWNYKVYYLTGGAPTKEEKKIKRDKLKLWCKEKYGRY